MQDPKFLGRLEKGRQRHGVTVRVVRKWTMYETRGHGAPLYVGMVLADAKGDAMYAEILDDLIEEKAYLFEVGKVYIIKKFVVNNAKATYKAVDKRLMIQITEFTTAEIVSDPPHSIPDYIYRISPFPIIKPQQVVYAYTDVIGYLVKYKAAHTFVPRNTEKAKVLREIYIKDIRDNIMKITLWGEHATNFNIDSIYDAQAGNLIVCLLVGCIPREDFTDNDKTCLTGSPACSYYFNPNVPEAVPFHSRFKNTPVFIECPPPLEEMIPAAAQDIQLPEKTIAALNHVDPFDEKEEGPFKCAVTIDSITNNNWWYMSCKPCKKKAEQQLDGSYTCPKCQGTNTVPRYLLSFIGKDETGEARFFAYDDEAQRIVNKDCQAIVNPLHTRDGLPQALQNIINKKFVFSIDLTNDSCRSTKNRQYQVKAVLERPGRRTLTQSTSMPHTHIASIDIQQHNVPQIGTSATAIISAHDPTSTAIIMSPQPQNESIQTEPQTQSTPAPAIDLDDDTSKNDDARSPRTETGARRSLLKRLHTTETDEEITEKKDCSQDSDDLDKTLTQTASSLQSKSKRAKAGTSSQDESDA